MDIKQKALKKYDEHIKWAEFQINEECPYCEEFKEGAECGKCPLHTVNGCCDGLWRTMTNTETWDDWIYYAKKIKKYIMKNG